MRHRSTIGNSAQNNASTAKRLLLKRSQKRFRNRKGDPVERTSFRRKLAILSSAAVVSASLFAVKRAAADVVLVKPEKGEGWEFYTNGRVNTFLSWAKGDGVPVA